MTTSFGDESSDPAKVQLGDVATFEVSPGEREYAFAWVVMNINTPRATTSMASKAKRFGEKNRIEPPRIQLVFKYCRDESPTYCDNCHL